MRPHGRARVSRSSPEAFAVCDRCYFLYNHKDLQWQYEWAGARTQNQNILVCQSCLDDLQEQFRTIVLPADPMPIMDPRPGRPTINNNPPTSLGVNIGTMTLGGGLDAAFDMGSDKPYAFCAQTWISVAGYNNSVGKYWYMLDPVTASRFIIKAPNNSPFLGSGPVNYKFQGSDLPVGWTDLYTGTTLGTIGETVDITLTPTTAYQYHQIVFEGDGINSIAIAQLVIYAAG